MSGVVVLALLWGAAAILAALLPRRLREQAVGGLIATGVPLLGWITYVQGPWLGLLALTAGIALLRWSVCRVHRWRIVMRRQLGEAE